MARIRPPAVAGSFYPAESHELKNLLDECFAGSPLGPLGVRLPTPSLLGGMVPHAGLVYSGACAAHLYAQLNPAIDIAILLGVTHRGVGSKVALSPADSWETPLGCVPVNRRLSEDLKERFPEATEDDRAHFDEHSIEVQLPFLQSVLTRFSVLPVSLSSLSEDECSRLGQSVAELYQRETAAGKKAVVLASSDLSHYLPPEATDRVDRLALNQVLALNPRGLLEAVREHDISMCGVFPTAVFLFCANALGAKSAQLLKHCHSGDVVPMREVVGYASVAVEL